MQTEKIYYRDPFCWTFDAVVVECKAGKEGWLITLDRTAFYPEGGGQPADHGTLGGACVSDVHEKDGVILHTCDRPLPVGERIEGQVDGRRRFDHMQGHSGEHIVSGILCAMLGYDNVGFHMGEACITIDFNGPVTPEQLGEVERRANAVIWADEAVEIFYPTPEELEVLEYRSKKALTGQVRIVRFPGADTCACCGTHVLRAGQVGLVKLLSCQSFRSGVRIEMLCGRRAMEYLSDMTLQNRRTAQLLSAKPEEAFAAVKRLKEEAESLKIRLTELENADFARQAEQMRGCGDVLLLREGLQPDGVRRLAIALGETCGGRAAVFGGREGDWKYALSLPEGDLRDFVREMNAALHGRGGGKPGFVQGGAACTREEIEAFFAR